MEVVLCRAGWAAHHLHPQQVNEASETILCLQLLQVNPHGRHGINIISPSTDYYAFDYSRVCEDNGYPACLANSLNSPGPIRLVLGSVVSQIMVVSWPTSISYDADGNHHSTHRERMSSSYCAW